MFTAFLGAGLAISLSLVYPGLVRGALPHAMSAKAPGDAKIAGRLVALAFLGAIAWSVIVMMTSSS